MFPVQHGILAQSQEGDSCVFPLDATPDQLALMGVTPFDEIGECGHQLRLTNGFSDVQYFAADKRALVAAISGKPLPQNLLFPPQFSGNNVVAFEVDVDIKCVLTREDVDKSFG